jgi:ABC-type transport system substrate-binding protein
VHVTPARRRRAVARTLALFAATGLGIAAVCLLAARSLSPHAEPEAAPATAADQAAFAAARDVSFDTGNPVVLHVDVDYAEGPAAPWYPKGQAPVLDSLVAAGLLPPVAERVGPEPAVMRGVDGIGRYGGTWMRVANSASDVYAINGRLSGNMFLRWSPLGYPLKPHLAKALEVSDDNRTFDLILRRGVRWSDGDPFDADDILYWWNDETLDTTVGSARVPPGMLIAGQPGTVEKVDAYHVRFRFPVPNSLFPETLARESNNMMSPVHYLRPYHPRLGDPALIEQAMRAARLSSPRALYNHLRGITNPEHPRMWPWVYRTFKTTPPQVFVRNPYYFVVDEAGNQLPYVDRVQFDVQDGKQIPISAANGMLTMQMRHINFATTPS